MPREKQFTVPDVLARAERRFSEYGYHATSVADLELAMRISRGSMYGTFDSKRELFVRALRHHLDVEGGLLQEVIKRATTAVSAIMELTGRVANNRFIVRAAVELASHDDEIGQMVAEAQCEVAHLFVALIERGQRAGEIDGVVDADQAGRALLALCIGAGVSFRATGEPAVQQQQVRALLPAPKGWG